MGIEKIPFLTTSWVLGQFAKTELSARKKFAEYVERGKGEGHRKELYSGAHDGRILGDDKFTERVLAKKIIIKKPHLDVVVRHICKDSGVTEEDLSTLSRQRKMAELRGIIGWLARSLEVATLSDVAKRFNRDLATISRAVRNIEERRLNSKELHERVESCLKYFRK